MLKSESVVPGVKAKEGDYLMLEIREGRLNIWLDWKEVGANASFTTDKEIGKEGNYIAFEFENLADGDTITYIGYDELD